MPWFYLYLICVLVALAHVWALRHNLAETRGQLLVVVLVALVPVVNIVLVLGYWYMTTIVDRFTAWLKKPLT